MMLLLAPLVYYFFALSSADGDEGPIDSSIVYTVTVNTGTNGTASVTSPVGTIHGGDNVTVKIVPSPGYRISKITDNMVEVSAIDNIYVIPSITMDHDIIVVFEIDSSIVYTVTVNADVGGSASATHGPHMGGDTVTVTIIPDKGHHVKTVIDNGVAVSASLITDNGDGTFSYTFEVHEDHIINVMFESDEQSFLGLTQTQWWIMLLVMITALEITIVCCYIHLRWKQEER